MLAGQEINSWKKSPIFLFQILIFILDLVDIEFRLFEDIYLDLAIAEFLIQFLYDFLEWFYFIVGLLKITLIFFFHKRTWESSWSVNGFSSVFFFLQKGAASWLLFVVKGLTFLFRSSFWLFLW